MKIRNRRDTLSDAARLGEAARLEVLRSYGVLDTQPEQAFDDIVRLAATACGVPMAVFSLITEDRVWFKARIGLPSPEYAWEDAICPYALGMDEPLVIPDTTADPRFAGIASVVGPPHLRFYAGVPITAPGGHQVGMLCVLDHEPRELSDAQIEALSALARQTVWLLERRADSEEIRLAGERWLAAESSRVAREQVIQSLEERFRLAFDEAAIGMALVDLRAGAVGKMLQVNRAMTQFLGYSEEELNGAYLQSVTHAGDVSYNQAMIAEMVTGSRDRFEIEKRYIHRDGTVRWGTVHSSALLDSSGNRVCMLNQIVDMTARHRYEEELIRAANTDALTGMPNRYALLHQLTQILEEDDADSSALLLIDLDSFKLVNNVAGHLAGDEVLRVVGARFAEVVGPRDAVARIGGDEFAVLCHDLTREEAIDLAGALIASLAEPVVVAGQEMYLSASVGVAWTTADDIRAGTVLENAGSAMYEAKRRGRARWEIFDDQLRSDATLRLRRASGLRAALQADELEMHYQPIVDLRSGQVVAAEALLRWNNPDEGVIWPTEFISVAEENGSIIAIGRWALHAACTEAARWGPTGPSISVNVSARQLADDDLSEVVEEALHDSGLAPARLTLEVTETAVMDDAEHAVQVLRRLKTLGVELAVDDFGTGYSSLVYLKRLPVDKLKIDRSFVDSVPDDTEDAAIVSSVVALARAVGLEVIAEGVETQEQWDALLRLGCDQGQGFLWGRPVPAAEATAAFSGPIRTLTPNPLTP